MKMLVLTETLSSKPLKNLFVTVHQSLVVCVVFNVSLTNPSKMDLLILVSTLFEIVNNRLSQCFLSPLRIVVNLILW